MNFSLKSLSLWLPKSKQKYDENPFELLEAHSVYLSVYLEDKFQLFWCEMP